MRIKFIFTSGFDSPEKKKKTKKKCMCRRNPHKKFEYDRYDGTRSKGIDEIPQKLTRWRNNAFFEETILHGY
jgi:hypothetical protein